MAFAFSMADSLDAIYDRALRALRDIEVEESSGKAMCRICSRPKSGHLHDGRCSTSAISREFVNERSNEFDVASRSLEEIEKLRDLSVMARG